MANSALSITDILNTLSVKSKRPRYAFMVLNLLAEQAGPGNKAGPFIREGEGALTLREWLGNSLSQMSGNDVRRERLVQKIRADLGDLPDDLFLAQEIIDKAVNEHVRATGADNASRVMVELERCGYLKRHYQGFRTNHENRGGQRHLFCVLDSNALAAVRRRSILV